MIFNEIQSHGTLNPDYALELCHEKLKCNESATYIRKA